PWLVLFVIFAVLALLTSAVFIVIVVIGETGRRRHRRRRMRENTHEEARTSHSASAKRRKLKPVKYHDEGTQSDITSDATTDLQTPTPENLPGGYFEPPQIAHDPHAATKDNSIGSPGGRGGTAKAPSANRATAKKHFGHQTP
ncbi:hypothetical protein AAVH_38402, partial [Aphelenchoides avenae]